jgi:hypothetical protein
VEQGALDSARSVVYTRKLGKETQMTTKGNVISCDNCGRQLSLPMAETNLQGKQSLDQRVRDYALQEGWKVTGDGHLCPDHD